MLRALLVLTAPALVVAAAAAAAAISAGGTDGLLQSDEKVLAAANIGTDTTSLLEFFRQRTLTDARRQRIAGLLQQLGDDDFLVRERATRELVVLGRPALAALRQAAAGDDAEAAHRARRCLATIDAGTAGQLPAAALRVLAARKAAAAIPVLLAYLPSAADAAFEEEIAQCLADLALIDGKPDPAVVAAARDGEPVRRLAAAGVLARASGAEYRATARKLLRDADARVRFAAARALLAVHDKAAVPTLIAILEDGPVALLWRTEDVLCRLAGEQAPAVALDPTSGASRRQARAAWDAWWQTNEAKIDLAFLERLEQSLGLTLICELDSGKVWECGPDGKQRWQITGLEKPIDAQVLPGGRVLIAEHGGPRVTERDRTGRILWERRLANSVVACQRLANGNTFIATHTELLEVTPDGKTVSSQQKPGSIYGAQKLPGGNILYVTSNNQLVEIDAAGKAVRAIAVGHTASWGAVELLPSGRYLVALFAANKVVEIDADGKVHWEGTVRQPTSATRLANGNTLVTDTEGRRVLELDRLGKKVWEQATEGRPFRVRRR